MGIPHAVSLDELTSRRHSQVTAFLADRSLDPGWLAALMRERVGDGLLLLTSSPVHGLANATSDLDFIRVQEEDIQGPRIATKIFERGHHLEVVSFSVAEVRASLTELDRLTALPPAGTVSGFRSWDKQREPRRKQTERIVNGLTLDGTSPYLDRLPSLSEVWCRASLQTAVEQVAHTALAESAGESRGRVGYACNALLHLMDALLSHHGDVYTTRKWYLLRWARKAAEGDWRDDRTQAAATELERLRKGIAGVLASAGEHPPLAGQYARLALDTARAVGVGGRITVRATLGTGVTQQPFLPGAAMLVGPGGSVMLPGRVGELPPLARETGLEELAGLAPADAAALLRALRAGTAHLHIGYHEETP